MSITPKITIDSLILTVNTKKSSSIFEGFFDNDEIPITLKSRAAEITILDFPENRPNDFTYISGNNLMMSSEVEMVHSADTTFTLNLTISGKGNLKFINPPKLSLPNNLHLLQVTNSFSTPSLSDPASGIRTFGYKLKADSAGNYSIPAQSISYFELDKNEITTITSPTISLNISEKSISKATITDKKQATAPKASKSATVILLDNSGSMEAQDFQPDRKTAAFSALSDFIRSARHDIGLVLFASYPHPLSPITQNRQEIIEALQTVDSCKIGTHSATSFGLIAAINELNANESKHKNIILLTDDGIDNNSSISIRTALEVAQFFHIPVDIIGISSRAKSADYTVEHMGTEFNVQHDNLLNDKKMQTLASMTGGSYFRAFDSKSLVKALEKTRKISSRRNSKKNVPIQSALSETEAHALLNLIKLDIADTKHRVDKEYQSE